MNKVSVNTPVGIISMLENDCFYQDMRSTNQYAEQIIIDNELKPYILSSNVILDIGAHVGYHSIAYARMNPTVHIHSFEPQSVMYNLLSENIIQNGYSDRIKTHNVCVGHNAMKITLSDYIEDGPTTHKAVEYGSSDVYNFGGLNIGNGHTTVDMITIDALNISNIDYMKIDVEGAESLVLLGARESIIKYKPMICFEDLKQLHINPSDLGIDAIPSAYDVLRSLGYSNFKQIAYQNVIATIQ